MKILIDINHPAHVHYFRNFIKIMKSKGHKFKVISRNKEIEHYLLNHYDIPFISRGNGGSTKIGKILYFFKAIFFILKIIKSFNPDLIMSFGTPYPAIAGKISGVPHISIYDTEHAKLHQLLTNPFSKYIINPSCYQKQLGNKQIKFNGYMELSYLHPEYFRPDPNILRVLNVSKGEKFVVIRFVSWEAIHDAGHKGFSKNIKLELIKHLQNYAKVFISSEKELPEELESFRIKVPPEKIHDALYYSSLFIGEGATMASECAVLGTPAIYINSLSAGYLEEQENYGLIYKITDSNLVLKKASEILNTNNTAFKNDKNMISDKIDVTKFFVWFFDNYPNSAVIMKENPSYHNKFKI